MKLSEKTLELNICAQVSAFLPEDLKIFWFGLTQKQEAISGFDACTKLCGKLLIFQFKASDHLLNNGARKFLAPHSQLVALQNHVRPGNNSRCIFYAFPLIGNTQEMQADPNLLSQTWLVDVASLPQFPPPTKTNGDLRKNGCHNVYVNPPNQTIFRSESVGVETLNAREFVAHGFPGSDGLQNIFHEDRDSFWHFCNSSLQLGAMGLSLYSSL
jgi:hypothetical protein